MEHRAECTHLLRHMQLLCCADEHWDEALVRLVPGEAECVRQTRVAVLLCSPREMCIRLEV